MRVRIVVSYAIVLPLLLLSKIISSYPCRCRARWSSSASANRPGCSRPLEHYLWSLVERLSPPDSFPELATATRDLAAAFVSDGSVAVCLLRAGWRKTWAEVTLLKLEEEGGRTPR